ncbi:hypothetical protein EV1_001857 [Malus domestica]|uniref:WD repeat-containing protein RUP2-like n=1 Tax=Malus sylvestris TaxID=3752 RepID=UPI0021AC5415|nr:WD repeat-containing protein RUP2-like [Malus sylvestris]
MKSFSSGFHFPDQPRISGERESTEEGKLLQQEVEKRSEFNNCEWDFSLSTVVSSNDCRGAASNTLGVIEFDPSNTVLATGGIARKIRVYSLKSLLPNYDNQTCGSSSDTMADLIDHVDACDYTICTPAKLSSLRWRPGSDGRVMASGDYDGVVTEYDIKTKLPIFERDEHGGRRVWSVDYSHSDPVLGASGSDDGTLQMWDPRCEGGDCVASVQPSDARSPVCCVEFDPFGGALLAVGCADRKAYAYDVRKVAGPVMVFDGHRKTVTYVRFLDSRTVVTAATDGCLKLWDTEDSRAIETYKGHANSRSFVGLSVWRNGGLIGCGSENNRLFVYDKRWGEPIWVHEFGAVAAGGSSGGCGEEEGAFVSSVCWRQVGEEQCTLVAGGSDGVLQVFLGRRKSLTSD